MPRAQRNDISEAIEALYRLMSASWEQEPPGMSGRTNLLLAVLDLIGQGKATPDRIPWSHDLRERFAVYFDHVRQHDDNPTPENPFLHLRKEQWWRPFRQGIGGTATTPLEATPSAGDATAGTVFATIAEPMARHLITPADRLRWRDALIARYFPQARPALSPLFQEGLMQEAVNDTESALGDDDTKPRPGRSCGFRRVILEIYDCQCAACGLRIKLPQIADLTFVDAAHLIPFSDPDQGANDHPTNGIALCKNHHWAMDQFVLVPARDHRWRVSPNLEPRRSSGEAELRELEGKPLLLPHDEAFHPSQEGLAWREQRLVA